MEFHWGLSLIMTLVEQTFIPMYLGVSRIFLYCLPKFMIQSFLFGVKNNTKNPNLINKIIFSDRALVEYSHSDLEALELLGSAFELRDKFDIITSRIYRLITNKNYDDESKFSLIHLDQRYILGKKWVLLHMTSNKICLMTSENVNEKINLMKVIILL